MQIQFELRVNKVELIIEKGAQIIHQATQLRSLYSKHLKVFSWKTGSGLGRNLLDTLQIKHKHPNATSLLDLYTGHWTVILIWWKSKFFKSSDSDTLYT